MENLPWLNQYGFMHRCKEIWWILIKRWSLHGAYQKGLDHGLALEYKRLIAGGAIIGELRSKFEGSHNIENAEALSLANRLREYVNNQHHVDPMSASFKKLIIDSSEKLVEMTRPK